MSWSFRGVGKPAALKAAIDKDVENHSGQSKAEYAAAAPHLKGLLDQAAENAGITLAANGHASYLDGNKIDSYINVELKQIGQVYS